MDPKRAGYDQPPPYEPPGSDVDERPQYRDPYRPDQYGQYSLQNVVSNNNTTVVTCMAQPMVPGQVIIQYRPSDYLVSSFLACLCCFCPTGIFAIYFASEARRLADVGDMANAHIMSTRARNLVISSVVIGALLLMCGCILLVWFLTSQGGSSVYSDHN